MVSCANSTRRSLRVRGEGGADAVEAFDYEREKAECGEDAGGMERREVRDVSEGAAEDVIVA